MNLINFWRHCPEPILFSHGFPVRQGNDQGSRADSRGFERHALRPLHEVELERDGFRRAVLIGLGAQPACSCAAGAANGPSIVVIWAPSAELTEPRRPGCDAIDMHCARAAPGDTATISGACQTQRIAQHPQQRSVRIDIGLLRMPVDAEAGHSQLLDRVSTAFPLWGSLVYGGAIDQSAESHTDRDFARAK